MSSPSASIIITSYNYASFLRQSIDSALAQALGDVEVIVVDDGSTDDSPRIIHNYGQRVIPILKDNAGQASAINTGFAACSGRIIILLDSDDMLLPDALRNGAPLFDDAAVAKVHWPMKVIDEAGKHTGKQVPSQPLSDGDLRETILQHGPEAWEWPPTSGNAWRREFLQNVLPIPEDIYRVCPDVYLAALVPMHGTIRRIDEPQSLWRAHGSNNTWSEPFEARLPRFIYQWDLACEALAGHCRMRGLQIDQERWKANAWCHRVQRAVEALCEIVPPGQTILIIDAGDWGADRDFFGRTMLPFPARDGTYWGPPADDHSAIDELHRQRDAGAGYLALAWSAFWWKEHYPGFLKHLRDDYRILRDDADLLVFDLKEQSR